ncbi:hypothetical protein [Prevotella koreensis]|uniref:Uncharacterized protein n=1 Tax=Prevotella koreensis TaxID=2490854 RepID=A0A432LI36_9BACT|nr:hypothetical protein [Prevotella koreensis]RUL58794.1 hypothetical protein EHV08_02755 [Prevotella koreensis]
MIIDILLGILLLLGIAWVTLGIAYLWRLFQDSTTQSGENNPNRKGNRQGERPKPSVSQEQIDNARHLLVGRSKPFVSPSISKVPAVSSTENPADNPNTFAAENSLVPEETEDAEGTEEDNELQVDYTMDESDEDSIVREELQIADAALPEVSPSAILAREVVRITGWHKNDDALYEENEAEVQNMLQSIRGTQLMDYIKEATLKQEKDHQKLLAAIRKTEEAELEESNISSSSDFETNSNVESSNSDVSEDDEHPLSYYL